MAENEELPKSGHIYTHHGWWPHKEPWKPDLSRCRCAVHDAESWPGFHQCNNKVKVTRKVLHHGVEAEFGYCNRHDPIAVAAKRAKQEAAWKAKWDAEKAAAQAKRDERELAERAIEALRQIAAGHNDPRSLAIEVLGLGAPA